MAKQHKNARTTPEVRAFIRESDLATAVLARLLKASETTVRKWRSRETTDDNSHQPKQLQTTLTLQQQYVVVLLRVRLRLSLDELLHVCKKFINASTSRAGLQRCLKRHGVSKLAKLQTSDEPETQSNLINIEFAENFSRHVLKSVVNPTATSNFLNKMRTELCEKDETPLVLTALDVVQVYLIKLPECNDEAAGFSLLFAHDLERKWVYLDIYCDDEFQAAQRYITSVLTSAPFHVRRILARNYTEFLSRFRLLDEQSSDASTQSIQTKSKNLNWSKP